MTSRSDLHWSAVFVAASLAACGSTGPSAPPAQYITAKLDTDAFVAETPSIRAKYWADSLEIVGYSDTLLPDYLAVKVADVVGPGIYPFSILDTNGFGFYDAWHVGVWYADTGTVTISAIDPSGATGTFDFLGQSPGDEKKYGPELRVTDGAFRVKFSIW